MKTIAELKGVLEKHREELKRKFNVREIGIFGSYVKGQFRKGSDIDIIVEFSESPDIFEFIRLEEFLRNLVGMKVDLVTKKSLKPLIKDEILKEAVYL